MQKCNCNPIKSTTPHLEVVWTSQPGVPAIRLKSQWGKRRDHVCALLDLSLIELGQVNSWGFHCLVNFDYSDWLKPCAIIKAAEKKGHCLASPASTVYVHNPAHVFPVLPAGKRHMAKSHMTTPWKRWTPLLPVISSKQENPRKSYRQAFPLQR